MSSARKRAAIQKANNEAEFLRQRLMRAEHHASVMQGFAEAAATKADGLAAILSAPVERGRCANLECVWWGGGAYLAGFNDAAAADIMAGTLRERLTFLMGSNVELTGAAQLHRAASRERSERGRP